MLDAFILGPMPSEGEPSQATLHEALASHGIGTQDITYINLT